MAGTPILRLSVASSAPDVTLFAWLESVDPMGRSRLITYGSAKASHREEAHAPADWGGAIYHASTVEAVARAAPLTIGFAPLGIALLPVAHRFPTGHRLRVSLSGSDWGNFEALGIGHTLRIAAGDCQEYSSHLCLPVLQATSE